MTNSHSTVEVILAPGASDAIAEAYSLASRLPESLFDFIQRRFLSVPNLFRSDCDDLAAVGTGRWTVTLSLSDCFLDLLAALRAGNFERNVSEVKTSNNRFSIFPNEVTNEVAALLNFAQYNAMAERVAEEHPAYLIAIRLVEAKIHALTSGGSQ